LFEHARAPSSTGTLTARSRDSCFCQRCSEPRCKVTDDSKLYRRVLIESKHQEAAALRPAADLLLIGAPGPGVQGWSQLLPAARGHRDPAVYPQRCLELQKPLRRVSGSLRYHQGEKREQRARKPKARRSCFT